MGDAEPYDPLALFETLEQNRVAYVVIGVLAEGLRGSREIPDDIEIVPALHPKNIDKLRTAALALGASDEAAAQITEALVTDDAASLSFSTRSGRLTITPTPPGTQGWEDLRRRGTREPLGRGVRPTIAALDDLVRMNEVATGIEHAERARTLRRMIELNRELGIDL